jgi:hypothetical protein
VVLGLDVLTQRGEAGLQVIIHYVLVEGQLLALLDLLPGVVQSLHNGFLGLSSSVPQPLLEGFEAWSLDENKIAVDLVIVNLLSPLYVNVQDTNLTMGK